MKARTSTRIREGECPSSDVCVSKFLTSDNRFFDTDSGNLDVLGNICVQNYALQSLRENSRIWEGRGAHRRSLHYATPDFLLILAALMHFMRPSLRKGSHAAMSSAAWQEIRVRSGRDDNSVMQLTHILDWKHCFLATELSSR